jgi:hypothetical protein
VTWVPSAIMRYVTSLSDSTAAICFPTSMSAMKLMGEVSAVSRGDFSVGKRLSQTKSTVTGSCPDPS